MNQLVVRIHTVMNVHDERRACPAHSVRPRCDADFLTGGGLHGSVERLARLSMAAGSALSAAQHCSRLGYQHCSVQRLARLSARLSIAAGTALSEALRSG